MANNHDIHCKIDSYLNKLDYQNAPAREKYDIVRLALFKYCFDEIEELGLDIDIEKYDYEHIEALLIEMHSKINDKTSFFKSCVCCILRIVGKLQNFKIVWIETTSNGDPSVTFTKSGKWSELITTKNTPYLTATIVTLQTFQSLLPYLEKHSEEALILDYEFE